MVDGKHAGNTSGSIPINNGTVNTNLNADLVDGKHIQETMSYSDSYIPTSKAIVNYLFPIGDIYVQYPVAESNNEATAFPTKYRPATKFGGTWSELYDDEDIFFRTKGTDGQTRTDGLSLDQLQGHDHKLWLQYSNNTPGNASRPDADDALSARTPGTYTATCNDGTRLFNGYAEDVRSNGVPRTGAKTEPKNRLFKVWLRTA